MKPRLFNLAAALSLVLCVATAGLWVRSFFSGDDFYYCRVATESAKVRELHVRTTRGWGVLLIEGCDISDDFYRSDLNMQRLKSTAGFRHRRFEGSPGVRMIYGRQLFEAPLAALVPPLAVLPLVWLIRKMRERRRRRTGACPTCGYDLRATPDRCPECGAVAEPSARTAA